jgi:hypothetical protein
VAHFPKKKKLQIREKNYNEKSSKNTFNGLTTERPHKPSAKVGDYSTTFKDKWHQNSSSRQKKAAEKPCLNEAIDHTKSK